MSAVGKPLVLASASPRRREILSTLGIAFEVRPSGADEAMLAGEAPGAYARRVAGAKALKIASACDADTWVLGADTIVVVGDEVLGKPEDDATARGMLRALAGRWHEVTTGVALCRAEAGLVQGRVEVRLVQVIEVTTRVRFRPLANDVIARYVATGEGRDKAGGYAVQGLGSGLVLAIEGSYSNVVGLPAAETVELLEAHRVIAEWPSRTA